MKVKAVEKKLKFTKDPNDPGVYRYVMSPEQYSSQNQGGGENTNPGGNGVNGGDDEEEDGQRCRM